jgi:putative heme-binding domain-containing protein
MSPQTRNSAAEVLLARPQRIERVLAAIEKGSLPPGDLEPARVDFLKTHRDERIRTRALELFANLKSARRQDVVDAYMPALKLKGDGARGKALFAKACAACHRLENVGHEIGPNLAAMQNRGPETILLNVLDPSREVNPQYLTYLVVTSQGRALTGMITAETATSITLKRADDQTDIVLRADIEEIRSTGMSLMPDGLEKDLDQQALADLIAYLMSLK